MNETVIVAIISLFGTLAGTMGGIITSSKLTGYRIEQLEEQVKKHNNLIDRMYKVEELTAVQGEQIAELNRKVS